MAFLFQIPIEQGMHLTDAWIYFLTLVLNNTGVGHALLCWFCNSLHVLMYLVLFSLIFWFCLSFLAYGCLSNAYYISNSNYKIYEYKYSFLKRNKSNIPFIILILTWVGSVFANNLPSQTIYKKQFRNIMPTHVNISIVQGMN